MAYPRFCVWCGAKVPKNAVRDLCVGHQTLASAVERRIQDRLDEDQTPMPIPLVRDADRPPNDGL